jgi:hypothetical protein
VSVLVALITLVLIALVVVLVAAPLRGDRGRDAETRPRLQELEAEREAKYREIRDAELDFRTGKLSREDYDAIDAALRAEAIEILNQVDRAAGADGERAGE